MGGVARYRALAGVAVALGFLLAAATGRAVAQNVMELAKKEGSVGGTWWTGR
ncbi:MAG: hypothetical protein ACRELA_14580 [Candidatus Rokuibacteriota bacterium]